MTDTLPEPVAQYHCDSFGAYIFLRLRTEPEVLPVGKTFLYTAAQVEQHTEALRARVAELQAELAEAGKDARIAELEAGLVDMNARKDAAYFERNQVVAALAKCFPSGVAKTAIEGWSEDWHGCVYIDLPIGQVSWHFHDSQAHLFDGLPAYAGQWDGHDTPEKYRRLAALPADKLAKKD